MKHIRYYLAAAIAALMFSSCEEHTDIYDNTLRVGNILLSDNSIISPEGYSPKSDNAVGVIFFVSCDTALIVARKEMGSHEYTDSLGAIPSVNSDDTGMCGSENTAAILASNFRSPATEAAVSYRCPIAGWVLPSAGELRVLSRNLSRVQGAMRLIGGDDFAKEQYLSSSQDGSSAESEQMNSFRVSLQSGFVTTASKLTPARVRPILRLH